jgi:hypothetical protein
VTRLLAGWVAIVSSAALSSGCSSTHEPRDPETMDHPAPAAGGDAGIAGGLAGSGVAGAGAGAPSIEKPPIESPPIETKPPELPPPGPWLPLSCGGSPIDAFDGVVLAKPVDYMAIYESSPVPDPPSRNRLLAFVGEACATASDFARCEAERMALAMSSAACRDSFQCGPFLLTIEGDEVTRSDERAALTALLGPIDSAEKALLIGIYDQPLREGLSCVSNWGNEYMQGTEVRASMGGFDIRHTWDDCKGDGSFVSTFHVARDGSVGEVTTAKAQGFGCAISGL